MPVHPYHVGSDNYKKDLTFGNNFLSSKVA
jgi:hypothetical protein